MAESPVPASTPVPLPSELDAQTFTALDVEFIRVLEDVIDALLINGTLRMTDLPLHAQQKINRRKQQRARLRNSLDFMPDDDELI